MSQMSQNKPQDARAKERKRQLAIDIRETEDLARRLNANKSLLNKINSLKLHVRTASEVEIYNKKFNTNLRKELKAIRSKLDALRLKPWRKTKNRLSLVYYILIAAWLFFLFQNTLSAILTSHIIDTTSKIIYIIVTLTVYIILFVCFILLRNFELDLFYGRNGEKLSRLNTGGYKILLSFLGLYFIATYFDFCFVIKAITVNIIYPSSLSLGVNIIQAVSSTAFGTVSSVTTVVSAIFAIGAFVWHKLRKKQKATTD